MKSLEGKCAIITGGAGGIGLATARRFLQEGSQVVIADLQEEKAVHAAGSLSPEGRAIGLKCDVSSADEVRAVTDQALRKFGRLDIVVNNAGLMIFKSIEDLDFSDWERVLRVDLLGAFLFTQQAFHHMKNGGAIVNISSIHAIETQPLVSAYAAAKAALVSLTRSAALEGKPKGIRVNAVLPGAVDTPMLWTNPNVKSGLEQIQRKDVGRPEDIAAVIAFLASDDAAFVQGASILVDGGRVGML